LAIGGQFSPGVDIYVANREALASFVDAWAQAETLADKAFGPELPAPLIGKGQAASNG